MSIAPNRKPSSGPASRAAAWLALALYGLAGRLATPLVRHHLAQRQARGREDRERLGERFGIPGQARPAGPLIWLHGASVGEALSALPLIGSIRRAHPKLRLLVTTGTVTSAQLMARRLPPEVIHQYAPVDLPAAVESFLDHWRPACGLILESELWPNMIEAAARRRLDLLLINGRMSPGSFRSWRRFPALARRLLGRFALVLAQSPEDAAHLAELGAPAPRVLGNLKFAAGPLPAESAELARLSGALGARPRWLAASTHPGEEKAVAEAHRRLATDSPELLTIIAPRHPDRGPAIAQLLRQRGLAVARRGAGEPLGADVEVYLADTIGELGLWYRLAEVVFVGGSLVEKGGQNLLEPAQLDCAVLTGPDTSNFARTAAELEAAGGLRRVGDAIGLAETVGTLLRDREARAAMAAAAKSYALAQQGCLERIAAAIRPHLAAAAAGRHASDGTP